MNTYTEHDITIICFRFTDTIFRMIGELNLRSGSVDYSLWCMLCILLVNCFILLKVAKVWAVRQLLIDETNRNRWIKIILYTFRINWVCMREVDLSFGWVSIANCSISEKRLSFARYEIYYQFRKSLGKLNSLKYNELDIITNLPLLNRYCTDIKIFYQF